MTSSKRQAYQVDPEVLTLAGVDYFIQWSSVFVGHSFFLPTTMRAQDVKAQLRAHEAQFAIELRVHNRVEYGRYGVRVWRIN